VPVEIGVLIDIVVALAASGHVVLNKRDVRGAAAWLGLVWLLPFAGAFIYIVLGINRLNRRARLRLEEQASPPESSEANSWLCTDRQAQLGADAERLIEHARVVDELTHHPLVVGNRIEPLFDGDEAYPAMLEAIRGAQSSVSLVSYIFEARGVGQQFVDALAEAVERGCEVRVLVDDVGARYGRPRIHRALRRHKVPVALFLPVMVPRSFAHINLRNHCKVMVVDGRVGFTGGMNIRPDCVLADEPRYPTRDAHFRVEGPIVAQLQAVFARDWRFTTGEDLEGGRWFPPLDRAGDVAARGITDGPDEDMDRMPWLFLSALAMARRSIRIVTPYFLPSDTLVHAMHLAARRGVEVDVILPEQVNLPVVGSAMRAQYLQVLRHGVRIWLTPPPFDHSKLFVVDGAWSSIGSSNWDPRSLRLNFEFNLECYDDTLAAQLEARISHLKASARPVQRDELEGRALLARLRDGTARLFQPYL
jgi:cardiolipin synthase